MSSFSLGKELSICIFILVVVFHIPTTKVEFHTCPMSVLTHKVWLSLIAQQDALHKLYSLFASIVTLFPCNDCAKSYLHKIASIFTYVYVEEERWIEIGRLCYHDRSQI